MMKTPKIVVMYPPPTSIEIFERVYAEEHVPLAVKSLRGQSKIISTRVLSAPDGAPAFHRIAEIHFPSIEALRACAQSTGGQETLAHAAKISSGGAPVVFIAEEEVVDFSA